MTQRRQDSRYVIDKNALALWTQCYRVMRCQLGMRAAGDQAGVSAAAIHRIEKCHQVQPETLLAVCRWMDANPYWFLLDTTTGSRVMTPAELVHPSLSAAFGVSRETTGETGAQ